MRGWRAFALATAAVLCLARAAAGGELEIVDLAVGEGRAAAPGDRVTVHYDGRLADGAPFDSSRERGQPFVFALGRGQLKYFEESLQGH